MLRLLSLIAVVSLSLAMCPQDGRAQHHNLPACQASKKKITRKEPTVAMEIPSRIQMGENRCDYDAMMWQAEFKGDGEAVVLFSCLFTETKETTRAFWEGKKGTRWVTFFPPDAAVVCTASLLGGSGPVLMTVGGVRYRRTEHRNEYDL